MAACRYGISLLVFNVISQELAVLTCVISSGPLEDKFHIYHTHVLFSI